MAVVISCRANAFQLHVTQKPLAEALSPENPHPTETLAKRQTTSVKTQGLCVELVQKDHNQVKFMSKFSNIKTQRGIVFIP